MKTRPSRVYVIRLTRDELAALYCEVTCGITEAKKNGDRDTARALASIQKKLLKEMEGN